MNWEHPIHTYPPKDALKMALAEIERLRALLRKRCCGDAECYNEDSGVECAALKDTKPNAS